LATVGCIPAVIALMRAADEPVGRAVKPVQAILPYHLE
jgi:hypothetical protein